MFKQIKDQWNAYVGPKDERLVAEENRLYAKLAKALLVIGIISMYYGNALRRAAGMFSDTAVGSKFYSAFPPEIIMSLGIIIACTVFSSTLTKQGVIADNRFAEVDTCPTGYFTLCSAIGAALVFVGAFVLEVLAQAQFVGFGGVYWAASAALAFFIAAVVFIGSLIGLVLYFRDAKKNRKRIEAELDD